MSHSNPGFEAASAGKLRPGYRDLIEQLQLEIQSYAEQVLLVHGDSISTPSISLA